ncbi:MAG: hypothetical protein LOX97_02765 [Sphingomonas sp.]|nr:hypothetical protein [Sphingomonas sp.]
MPGFASLLAASALRAASLNMCADEYLLLLARPREIASVSRLTRDPADSPLWRQARRFKANRGTLESVLDTRPTLVITMGGSGRATAAIARTLGLRTLDLPFPLSIDDVAANMDRVASALGQPARALPWKRRLARLRAATPAQRDAIFLGAGGNSFGEKSLEAEWMSLAGFRQRPLPGGRASLELLATRPPRVLLRSTYRQAQYSLGQSWLNHPLASPRGSTVIEVDGRPWTCGGPLMVGVIEQLRNRS